MHIHRGDSYAARVVQAQTASHSRSGHRPDRPDRSARVSDAAGVRGSGARLDGRLPRSSRGRPARDAARVRGASRCTWTPHDVRTHDEARRRDHETLSRSRGCPGYIRDDGTARNQHDPRRERPPDHAASEQRPGAIRHAPSPAALDSGCAARVLGALRDPVPAADLSAALGHPVPDGWARTEHSCGE